MELSFKDKIMYYGNYIYDGINSQFFPYKIILINNKKDDYLKKNMNLYSSNLYYNKEFERTKIIVLYEGEKKFIASFYAETYCEIEFVVQRIIFNDIYENKIKSQFPNFIENIYFICKGNIKHDITELINKCINYENNNITFGEIAKICSRHNILEIKIVYVQKFKKMEKILDYNLNKNNDIGMLNDIFG